MRRLLKCFSIFSFVAFSALNANAQQKYIGVVLGANLANESLDAQPGGVTISDRTGILAGIQSERWFSPQWGFSSQLMYVQEGRNDNINGIGTGIFYGTTTTGYTSVEANYLEVTLLIKYAGFGNNVIRPYVFAGPSLGAFLSGNVHSNITVSQKGSQPIEVDTTYALTNSNVNTFEFSAVLGIGVSVKLDSGPMLFLDASYWYGLTNIFDSYGGATYTRDIRIATGILFPINLPSLFRLL
jgi:hypothetical protein